MTADDFTDHVRTDNTTALSRLGSSKALYAETAGELETETVLRAAALAEASAHETFTQWADTESDESAAELFFDFADQEADHYETVADRLAEPPAVDDADLSAMQTTLRGFETTVERAGGLVGRCLVAKQSKQQYTGYFVGDADPRTASVFRELGEDVTAQLERATTLVERVCETDVDTEQAHEAATATIQAAYDEYTTSLESLGVNPKPVC